jgi:hypothetical protein
MGTKQVCIMLGVYYSKEIGRGLTQINAEVKGKRHYSPQGRKERSLPARQPVRRSARRGLLGGDKKRPRPYRTVRSGGEDKKKDKNIGKKRKTGFLLLGSYFVYQMTNVQ